MFSFPPPKTSAGGQKIGTRLLFLPPETLAHPYVFAGVCTGEVAAGLGCLPKPAGSNARTAPRPDRMSRLQDLPRLKSEAQTIRVMVEEFCSYHHGTSGHMLCPKCQAFLDYALKRLACCPYGEDKPVCGSCKIHCYKPAERETARQVMRWAGPRLIFSHPLMAVSHVVDKLVHKAPDKPRNTARAKPAVKPAAQTPSPSLPLKNNNKS